VCYFETSHRIRGLEPVERLEDETDASMWSESRLRFEL
jgi:hypothetical protein